MAVVMILVVAWLEARNASRKQQAADWVAQTHAAEGELHMLEKLALDVETGGRGYVITGNAAYLEPFESASRQLVEQQQKLARLIRDPQQMRDLGALEPLIERGIAITQRIVQMRQVGGFQAAQDVINGGEGKQVMDQLRAEIGRMHERQKVLLQKRSVEAQEQTRQVRVISAAGAGLSVLLLGVVFIGMLRENQLRVNAYAGLAERELELSRFKDALDQTIDCVFMFDADNLHFTYANRGASLQVGYTNAELLQMSPSDIKPEITPDRLRDLLQPILIGEIPSITFETLHRHKDGHTIPVEVFVQIVRQEGRAPLFVNIVRDSSARKANEQALIEARLTAEQANASKGTFLATMSHEIRTPLNGLLGMMELLDRTPLDREQKEMLAITRDSGLSMGRIIDDILDHAKIEAGKLDILPEPISIASLTTRVMNTFQALASTKDLVLRQVVDPRLSRSLLADPLRLQQVLGNFVSNAVKFTTEGYVEVRAELVRREGGNETVRLAVRDTGIGMSEEAQLRIFRPFEQATATTSRLYGGTGLGLAICTRLIELMGGEIKIESELGAGTTMSVVLTLPVADVPPVNQDVGVAGKPYKPLASAKPLPTSHEAVDTRLDNNGNANADPTRPWSGRAPVLVADDNPINRILIERQLASLGLKAQLAEDGTEALRMWQEGQFSLIITDVNMPGLDGYALTRVLREIEAQTGRPRMPVAGWTASALPDTLDKCLAAGMDDVLTKPSNIEKLTKVVAKLLPLA